MSIVTYLPMGIPLCGWSSFIHVFYFVCVFLCVLCSVVVVGTGVTGPTEETWAGGNHLPRGTCVLCIPISSLILHS